MLAEMAMTPLSNGKSLLDDTLVLVTSELGRSFPMSGSCDHWAYNSYLVAGGGVHPNRMCGGYDVDTGNSTALGFPGLPVALVDMDGNTTVRVPTSEDMVYTALALFGIDSVAFSSNPSRVLGLLS